MRGLDMRSAVYAGALWATQCRIASSVRAKGMVVTAPRPGAAPVDVVLCVLSTKFR